jgi:hypothetical protein
VAGRPDDLHDAGLEVAGYEIYGLLGRGGMGAVYLARQLSVGQPVAIKVLGAAFRAHPGFVARFKREAALQVSLQHPNIVPVLDSGEAMGVPYIVMRFIDGMSMRELIRTDLLPAITATELLTGIASALDCAHAKGVLHLDVKPHNILVEYGRHAWLADFGLTRMLEEATGLTLNGLVGTFDYLAPEIARGESPSAASDIYSLAVTAYHCFTGTLPFPVAHQAAAVFAHASAPRPQATVSNPVLPVGLDRVLQRGMAILPEERQASAGLLLDQVREAFDLSPASEPLLVGMATMSSANHAVELPSSAPTAAARPTLDRVADAARVRGGWRGSLVHGRFWIMALMLLLLTAVATVGLVIQAGGSPRFASATFAETVGGDAHTWANYQLATGTQGPLIPAGTTVQIACKLHGYRVQDGNTWWYRVASKPWSGRFYVSADAFYNDGRKHGSLTGTPFVDPKVHAC